MKLHESAVKEIMNVADMYNGRREPTRFAQELGKIELVIYKRKSDGQEILVTQKEIDKQLKPNPLPEF